MRSRLRIPVFALLLAQATCNEQDCSGCNRTDHLSPELTVQNSQRVDWSAGCSTLCHAEISAYWYYEDTTGGEDPNATVDLEVYSKCGSTKSVAKHAHVAPFLTTMAITDLGVKNLCGENDPVDWYASLYNGGRFPLTRLQFNILCPEPGASPRVAPSAVR